MVVIWPDDDDGSIPACAGEPRVRSTRGANTKVYPRVCGGTGLDAIAMLARAGLSPRVRGNLNDENWRLFQQRSIPACAGEPYLIPAFLPML